MSLLTSILLRLGVVKNVRRGFATNSSSSHSFVYLKKPVEQRDVSLDELDTNFDDDDFRLETVIEKLLYTLTARIGWQMKGAEADEEAGQQFEDIGSEYPELGLDHFKLAARGYVGHNSKNNVPDVAVARDPRVVIFGGYDGVSRERDKAVASGEIDWTISEPERDEDYAKPDFPFAPGDLVTIKGEEGAWIVNRAENCTAYNVYRYLPMSFATGSTWPKMQSKPDVPTSDLGRAPYKARAHARIAGHDGVWELAGPTSDGTLMFWSTTDWQERLFGVDPDDVTFITEEDLTR